MNHPTERLVEVRSAVERLAKGNLREAGKALLSALGYSSPKTLETAGDPGSLLDALGIERAKFETIERWRSLDLVFQLTGDELPSLSRGSDPQTDKTYQQRQIDSFVFLALDLDDQAWGRRDLVGITRELNRGFAMPAIVLFRQGGTATLAVIDRRPNKRDSNRDVVGGRISLVKDIDLHKPHRAHIQILADLTLSSLRPSPVDFRSLYDSWLKVLSASELNKRFYRDLADWFAWASTPGVVQFPPGQGNEAGDRETGIIRLLTRLMFVWFIKQKGLVREEFFDGTELRSLLKESPSDVRDGHSYYTSVLQNLFFACLNTEQDERDWLPRDAAGKTDAYLVHNKYRNKAAFADPDSAKLMFGEVPFLNGGLFDCLDVEIDADDPRAGRARREGSRGLVLRVDGFSEEPERQPRLPNALFFGGQEDADLRKFYNKQARRDVKGLIDLFDDYKFTVEENTPLEEEAALDPELLGKVFENLLASYNEDTQTSARNKSGSFYTPREVVDFMVDEALIVYLAPVLPEREAGIRPRAPGFDLGPAVGELALVSTTASEKRNSNDREARLRKLLSYAEQPGIGDFSESETNELILAIERCRAIDPAVGSGAFPLGLLQKLVHVLSRLDPEGSRWKAANRRSLEDMLAAAERSKDLTTRPRDVANAKARLAEFDATWPSGHHADYARKLYLIEGCLHGVDIQPIAVQIAKLRCFIALAVEQKVENGSRNRGVTPLPNLEMKFVAANTLRPLHSNQLQLRDVRLKEIEAQRREANASLFSAHNRRAKKDAQKRIKELRERQREILMEGGGFPAEDARAVVAWDPFDANAAAAFFDAEWMFGFNDGTEGCFDIVFANPPYVRQEKIESFRIEGESANLKSRLKADYDTFTGTADIYIYFYERAVRMLKPGGAMAFITSNKWYRAGYGAKLRKWISEETRLLSVIDFGDAEVFEAIAYPTIVVAKRRKVRQTPASSETFRALNWSPGDAPEGFPDRFVKDAFSMPQASLLSSGWQFERQDKRELLARLRSAGTPLGEWCGGRFYRGILTGLNEAFVIDGAKRAELIAADPNSADIIKPFLRGRDVKRWQVEPADKWLIFIPWHFPLQDDPTIQGPSAKAEAEFRSRFPAIYAHLLSFKPQLSARNVAETGVRYEWYALQRWAANYWREFSQPKIVYPDIYEHQSFAFDADGRFAGNTCYFIPTSKRWLTGILNSLAVEWFYRQTSSAIRGGYLRAFSEVMQHVPIPAPAPKQEALITVVVDAILAGAKPRARFESLINAFVYELFLPEEFSVRKISAFGAAQHAGLPALIGLSGDALAREAEAWSPALTVTAHPLYATLFELQSIGAVRIIEGR
ncbi:TaqI-like C-terminal specificity domain-containing protein [Mesorhizobium sp. M0843]|uniref:Eco57I restriction-modification methylase domain-containing protein n=1 Tax=Mesorhizobium sp. M0843 TaxID=2957010 RepID=UPI00333D771C